jgi:PGF-pre-PGF domain-containing protein
MKKYILLIFLTVLLTYTNSSAALATYVSTENLFAESGSVIDAVIELNTTEIYGAGTIIIDFKPDILEVTDVKNGVGSTVAAWNSNNTSGSVQISAWNVTGTNGSTGFAIICFKAKNPGKSPLNITINTLKDTSYEEIAASIINGSITVAVSQSQTSRYSSSGGGDEGSGTSGEAYENIILKERYNMYIYKDKTTSYRFAGQDNPIEYINITGNVNAGEITASVEVLQNTSRLLNISPPGIVFRNVNIWIGTSGFATLQNIKKATVNFKVDKEWLEKNNIAANSIKLMRYSDRWNVLPTQQIGETEEEIHYQADTEGFTFFSITGEDQANSLPFAEIAGQDMPAMKETIKETGVQTAAAAPTAKEPGFKVLFTGICFLLVYSMRKMNY